MRIDLRYIIPIVLFYVPGVMLLVGAWVLGYSVTGVVRDSIAGFGAIIGFVVASMSPEFVFVGTRPIWLTLWRRGGSDEN